MWIYFIGSTYHHAYEGKSLALNSGLVIQLNPLGYSVHSALSYRVMRNNYDPDDIVYLCGPWDESLQDIKDVLERSNCQTVERILT